MQTIQLVIFDLAGTTIEDSGQVSDAFTRVLHAYGFDLTAERLKSFRGASKREVIRSFVQQDFPDQTTIVNDRTEQIFGAFRECLVSLYITHGIRAIQGTRETFEWLRGRNIKIALNTGFDRVLTDFILQDAPWNKDLINAVVCGDDVVSGRPAPDLILRAMDLTQVIDVNDVANVGDTVLDLQAGANAGVRWNVGVLSGAHGQEQMERAPHTHLIPSVESLPSLWS